MIDINTLFSLQSSFPVFIFPVKTLTELNDERSTNRGCVYCSAPLKVLQSYSLYVYIYFILNLNLHSWIRLCSLTDRKHPEKAQLSSFYHGAAENTGRAAAIDTFGGEGNFFWKLPYSYAKIQITVHTSKKNRVKNALNHSNGIWWTNKKMSVLSDYLQI